MNHKKISPIMILIAAMAATGCTPSEVENNAPLTASNAVTEAGVQDSYEETDVTHILMDDQQIDISGNNARADQNQLTITAGGTYLLTGNLNGSVIIDAPAADQVHLILNGVTIQADQNAAIYGKQAGELIITLEDGTENFITDAAGYTYSDEENQEPDAALFSKNDLEINGNGSLTVTASFYNGIGSKDNLIINDQPMLIIDAANHGIRGRDSLTIMDGTFDIKSGSDGIQSNNDQDSGQGWILLEGGNYTIESGNDGIQAETDLTISGGNYQLINGGGYQVQPEDTASSYKGLKAGAEINITAGVFAIDSADDTIHSNGNISISGGDFTLTSGDDAVHADGNMNIIDGVIDIISSYEGLEAMTMTIAGGEIGLIASDDGLNIAGGTDQTTGGRFGTDQFSETSTTSEQWLRIEGGTIAIDAEGDGIDINGSGVMSGGTVIVDGPVTGGNGALDYDGTFEVTGGNLIALGSSGMVQAPSQSSTQPSMAFYYNSVMPAGTIVELKDKDGTVLDQYTSKKQFQCIIFTNPEMTVGESYTVSTDGATTAEITLTEIITSVSETGEAVSSGGRGGMGGGRPEGGRAPMGRPEDNSNPPNAQRPLPEESSAVQ